MPISEVRSIAAMLSVLTMIIIATKKRNRQNKQRALDQHGHASDRPDGFFPRDSMDIRVGACKGIVKVLYRFVKRSMVFEQHEYQIIGAIVEVDLLCDGRIFEGSCRCGCS